MDPQDSIYFLLKGPSLPPASIALTMLGRVVKNFAQPLTDAYAPEDASPYISRPIIATPLTDVENIAESIKGSSVETKLSNLAGLNRSKAEKEGHALQSPLITSFELQNYPDVFRKLMQHEAVKAEISSMTTPGGKPLFFIVGVLVFEEAQRIDWTSKRKTASDSLALPLGAAGSAALVATTGIPLDLSAIQDISQGYSRSTGEQRLQSAVYGDSRVFALQCRVVRRRLRSYLHGSEPALMSYGPRVEAPRTYADAKSSHAGADETNHLELDPLDEEWINALDEEEYGDIEDMPVTVDKVSFVLASD